MDPANTSATAAEGSRPKTLVHRPVRWRPLSLRSDLWLLCVEGQRVNDDSKRGESFLEVKRPFKLFGAARPMVVVIDGVEQAQVGARGSVTVQVSPGRHRVQLQTSKARVFLTVDVVPGATTPVSARFVSISNQRRLQLLRARADGLDPLCWAGGIHPRPRGPQRRP